MQIGSILRQTGGVMGVLMTIALALALIAVPYAVRSQRYASLPDATTAMAEAPVAAAPAERTFPVDPEAEFAFGFLVFDWDPRATGGVPGFGQWIPSAQPNAPVIHAEVP